MQIRPEKTTDGGFWISDDRVYAFVSAGDHCVGEIGYHGPQPVSRNSRIFAGRPRVLDFTARAGDGPFLPILFKTFDWYAAGVCITGTCGTDPVALELTASGNALLISVSPLESPLVSLRLTFSLDSLFKEVHGERTWTTGNVSPPWWEISFHDRVLLNEWLMRTGPYAGDFLLPEPLRRTVFTNPVRSGLATIEDVRPEFRNAPIPVYDASVPVWIGGPGYTVDMKPDAVLLSATVTPGGPDFPPLCICFRKPELERGAMAARRSMSLTREHYQHTLRKAPVLAQPAFPRFEEFFSTVPALVESCLIRDHRIPRATPGRYYWIWAWDAIVTALSALLWGAGDIALGTAEFINAHRDRGEIPMRWTHALEPLDIPPRGALETLLASLASATATEIGEFTSLDTIYPRLVDHLRFITGSADRHGLFSNSSFYPDLPHRFGRTESSAVALEIGCFYTFCRTIEVIAHRKGDLATADMALAAASLLEKEFIPAFWDSEAGFLFDAIDLQTGHRNQKHPIFSLLFLHSPLGWRLVRDQLAPLADFISQHLQTGEGMRVVPAGESWSETIANAWYPHWDLYALKVLRRGGHSKDILRWLTGAERLLDRLGFCPEFLSWDAAATHGAPSNLNCVTGWYQGFLEGVVGLESDPGGLTVVPLGLPLPDYSLTGIVSRGTRWNVTVLNRGEKLQSMQVDGTRLRGCLKVPARYSDGGEHHLLLAYGKEEETVLFREIVNAEVLELRSGDSSVELVIRALGQCDVVFSAPAGWHLSLDGKPVAHVRPLQDGTRGADLSIRGEHILRLAEGILP